MKPVLHNHPWAVTAAAILLAATSLQVTRTLAADAGASAARKGPPPAMIDRIMSEAELNTITLTPEAERRLGIVTMPVARGPVGQTRLYGGQVIVPPRGSAQAALGAFPAQTPADFARLADDQTTAEGQVARARAQVEGARAELARTERMLREGVGTGRAVDDARTLVRVAEADMRTAQSRRDLLGGSIRDAGNLRQVWVRASVYVGDLNRLNAGAAANIGGLGDAVGGTARVGRPVAAPAATSANGSTVDLFYTVENGDRTLRPGQRVGVYVPLRGERVALTAPWAAVVHDAYGGQWVYEQIEPRRYARRRVQVEGVRGALAVLTSGPAAGARVVTSGAAELFGAEFGIGK